MRTLVITKSAAFAGFNIINFLAVETVANSTLSNIPFALVTFMKPSTAALSMLIMLTVDITTLPPVASISFCALLVAVFTLSIVTL